jgi:hypothetical protein
MCCLAPRCRAAPPDGVAHARRRGAGAVAARGAHQRARRASARGGLPKSHGLCLLLLLLSAPALALAGGCARARLRLHTPPLLRGCCAARGVGAWQRLGARTH